MPRLDDLLATDDADEAPKKASLDELLATEEKPAQPRPQRSRAELERELAAQPDDRELPWYRRAARGFTDPLVGVGQLAQNVIPDAAMNVARKSGASILSAVGADELASEVEKPISTEAFNAGVRRMEQSYQADRANAGQDGLDTARVAGTVTNPLTWLGASKASSVWQAVKSGAQTGAFQALLQPVTSTSNFLYSKGMQMLTGATLGGALGGAVQAVASPLGMIVSNVRKLGGDTAQKATVAAQETDDLLRTAGADPMKMDPRLYSAIQREVAEAVDAGFAPDARVITNRADAAALPIPMQISRGQATRDPMQFSWEQNNAKLRGVGEPLTQMFANQNRQLIENLNELGARNAMSPFDTSKAVISRIQQLDDAATAKINEAYQKVRDSAGRPALMDHVGFVKQANDGLDYKQLGPYLPAEVRTQLNDIAQGKLPLTVNVAQQLDKVWSAAQRGSANDSAKLAIGQLREALNSANVSDALGADSMAAYKAAREMARQRFATIDANPAYKAVVDGTEPDKFFQKYVTGANASEIEGLTQLVGPELTKHIQQTSVANLKSAAVNRASDENGVFSQAAYNKLLQDPVYAPRLAELFKSDPATLDQLYRLGRVSENVVAFPKMHSVNTSNTTPTAANLVRDLVKDQGEGLLSRMFPLVGGLRKISRDYTEAKAVSEAVDQAVRPGVTTAPIVKKPASAGRLSDLAAASGGAYAASDREE